MAAKKNPKPYDPADEESAAPSKPVKMRKPAGSEQRITLPPLQLGRFRFKITGDSELLVHNWSQKAIQEILDKQMKKPSSGRAAKDPDADFEASLYRHPEGGYGFPSVAFKKAAVDACTSLNKAITMKMARQAFHIPGRLVKVEGTPVKDIRPVRLNGKTTDIRIRAIFHEWSAWIEVIYNVTLLSPEQIVNLFSHAGFGVGVGEFRPEKSGDCGRFRIDMETSHA